MRLPSYLLSSTLLIAGLASLGLGELAFSDDSPSALEVKLERLNWKQFQKRLVATNQVKYTIVDAWSTTCGPCKENFPHLVEMHHK